MNRILVCAFAIFSACGGEETPISSGQAQDCREVKIDKSPAYVRVWLDPDSQQNQQFVLNALSVFWKEIGVKVVKAGSWSEADIGVVYAQGACSKPLRTGRLGLDYWAKLDSIIVDTDCFSTVKDYDKKFPAAVSHALGNLMGIEACPDHCGAAVMSLRTFRMEVNTEYLPQYLSSADKTAYWYRRKFLRTPQYIEVCDSGEWKEGSYETSEKKTVRFWVDSVFDKVALVADLNKYYKAFGRSFELGIKAEAQFVMVPLLGGEEDGCSPLAITYAALGEIQVKISCFTSSEDQNLSATIAVHEVGHLFGMQHIPNWCGDAIMNPYLNSGSFFTQKDVLEWVHRDKSEAVLE